jgi:hypothetical protein
MAYLTIWPALTVPHGKSYEMPWEAVFERFEKRTEFRHDLHQGWSPALFEGDKREAATVRRVFALVLDVDGMWSLDAAEHAFGGHYGLIHTSKRHTEEVHRFRVVLPLSRPVSAFEHAALWRRVDYAHPGRLDPQAKDASRFWYLPGVIGGGSYETRRLGGEPLDVDEWLARAEPVEETAPRYEPSGDVEERARKYIARMDPAISGAGGHTATWAVAIVLAKGFALSEQTTLAMLRAEFNPRCQPPWSERELAHKARQACAAKLESGYLLRDERRSVKPPVIVDYEPPVREPGDDSEEPTPEPEPQEVIPQWRRRGVRTLEESLRLVYERCQRPEPQPSCSACHLALDRAMGGFRRGRVAVVGAVTSWGKSSYALLVANRAIRSGKRVLFVSAEDDEITCAKRIASLRGDINAMRLRDEHLTDCEHASLFEIVATAEKAPWFLNGIGKGAERLAALVSEVCAEHQHDLVIVDYLQAIAAKAQDRRNEVSTVARLLTDAIKTGGAAGLLLSQIKRLDGRDPTMHDLKESGDVENMAEHIMLGTSGDGTDSRTGQPELKRYLELVKNKDGPTGGGRIWMPFESATASFREVT